MAKKLSFTTLIILLIALLAVCFAPVSVVRADQNSVDYEKEELSAVYDFEQVENGYYISAYKGKEVNIEIPDYYNGLPVTGIADAQKDEEDGVFYNTNIVQVKLGKNVKYIGRGAFRDCDRLESFIANDVLEEIHSYAFYNCTALTQLDLPKLKRVGFQTFEGSGIYKQNQSEDGIVDYYYEDQNNKILLRVKTIIGESYEVEQGTHLIAQQAVYPTVALSKLILPTSIEYLGNFIIGGRTAKDNENYKTSYADCEIEIKDGTSLEEFSKTVNFGEASFSMVGKTYNLANSTHVNYIGKVAVLADNAISAECKIVDGTEKIAGGAFKKNETLQKIIIPSSVTYIGEGAFENCKNLTEVVIDGNVEIDKNAFYGCEQLSIITGNIKSVNGSAFYGCNNLKAIKLSVVESIGEYAFANTGLEELTLSDNAKIGAKAFDGNRLKEKYSTNGLLTVGNHILGVDGEQEVSQITVENKIIADMAFENANIVEITLTNCKLGKGAFWNCLNLQEVTFDGTVVSEDCFYGAKELSVFNQSNVTEILPRAFFKTAIENFDFSKVAFVGEYAFSESNLNTLYLGSQTVIEDFAFFNTPLTQISVSAENLNYTSADGVLYDKSGEELLLFPSNKQIGSFSVTATKIAKGAFAYSKNLQTVEGDFSQIDDKAFYGSSVTSVIGEKVEKVGYKAFYGGSLTVLNMPELTDCGYKAFAYCRNLSAIYLSNGEFNREYASFKGCDAVTEITLSFKDRGQQNKTFSVGYLFGGDYYDGAICQTQKYSDSGSISYYIPKIEKITVTEGKIKFGAMMNLTYLKQVVISESVTELAPYAFFGCSSLAEINLNDNIGYISKYCFAECGLLESIDLSNVSRVDSFAFLKCSQLNQVTVSEKLTYIGAGAFSQTEKLKSVIITDATFFDNFDNDCSDYGLLFEHATDVKVETESLTQEQIDSLRLIKQQEDNKISKMEITIIVSVIIAVLLVGVYFIMKLFIIKKEDNLTRPRRQRKTPHKHHRKHHVHRNTHGGEQNKNDLQNEQNQTVKED